MNYRVSFMPDMNYEINTIDDISKNYHLYIHIPFCRSSCLYCGIKVNHEYSEFDLYIEALKRELEILYEKAICPPIFKSIHIGGGTPSILSLSQLQKLFKMLKEKIDNYNQIEKVFEANPESLSVDKIEYLSSVCNLTLSIGIQSLNPDVLRVSGRMSNKKIIKILEEAVQYPFAGIGVDLICGLPLSTKEIFLQDINELIAIGVDSFSIYPLWIESNSILGEKYNQFKNELMIDTDVKKSLEKGKEILLLNGYVKRSVYHYIKCNKNLFQYANMQIYGEEWIGIGSGATSYFDRTRKVNIDCIEKYIDKINSGKLPINNIEKYSITDELLNKLAYILRKPVITIDDERKELGEVGCLALEKLIKHLKNIDFIKFVDSGWQLTNNGIINLGMISGNYIKKIIDGR